MNTTETAVARPRVADVVQYVQESFDGQPGDHPLAAIVTGFPDNPDDELTVHLFVLSISGFFFAHNVPHTSRTILDGTWRWPDDPDPRVPAWFNTDNGFDTQRTPADTAPAAEPVEERTEPASPALGAPVEPVTNPSEQPQEPPSQPDDTTELATQT